ncbi:MAG: hypothetical protein ACRDLL_08655 [Solirubrobacterales bacterium]
MSSTNRETGSPIMPTPEELDLLHRFAPRLHFDALERWRPSIADGYMAGSAFFEGEVALEGTPPAGAAMLARLEETKSRLNPLGDGPGLDTQLRSNLMLRSYGDDLDLDTPGTSYGRVARVAPDTLFLQYWLFYGDNPCVLPPGRHDGDWELVQLRLHRPGRDWQATHLTLAEHGKPVTYSIEADELPVDVFVAVDSHACYSEAGAHPMVPLSDVCDTAGGEGAVPGVQALPLAEDDVDWAHWHGRWGMDQGPGTLVALWLGLRRTPSFLKRIKVGAGESPPSPARQGMSWDRPDLFALRGKTRRATNVGPRRLIHFIGRLTWPRLMPAVKVERVAPHSFVIDAKPAGHLFRRVSLVSVAFEEEETGEPGTRKPLARYAVRAGQPAGPFEIPHEKPLYWRSAGYNFLRQRGEPAARRSPADAPWPLKASGRSSDDQGARRVFEGALTGHLRRRGAVPIAKLVGAVGWFWLRLDQTEVERVVDAARRDGLIAPLGQSRDAAGEEIGDDEWTLTDRGRELERTRALSIRDSIVAMRGVGQPVVSAAEKWGKRIVAIAAPFLPFLALGSGLNVSVAIAVVAAGAILALSLGAGLRGETELRRAAEHWPRLRTCRPNIHAWQTASWRPWERVPIAAAAALYLIASAAILRCTDTWSFNVWLALGVAAAIAALAWWRLHDAWAHWLWLNKAFREERNLVEKRRRTEPSHPCVWGASCEAALGGAAVSCPRFGREAPAEPERIH